MSDTIEELLNQSILLEQNASRLYSAFGRIFEADRPFWNRLSAEERNHAALLRTLSEDLSRFDASAEQNLFTESLQSIIEANVILSDLIESLDSSPPERSGTFDIALSLETGTGEKHLHALSERLPSNTLEEVISVLLDADRKHAERIRAYAKHCGLFPGTSG